MIGSQVGTFGLVGAEFDVPASCVSSFVVGSVVVVPLTHALSLLFTTFPATAANHDDSDDN